MPNYTVVNNVDILYTLFEFEALQVYLNRCCYKAWVMHHSFIFMTVVFNFSLLSTRKSILDCSRHFAEFLGKKHREKRGNKTSLSTRTKLNKFGRSLFWWIHRKCTPVLSLESQQPVENHLQHRSGSKTGRPGVVQWFPVNGCYQYPKEWHKG